MSLELFKKNPIRNELRITNFIRKNKNKEKWCFRHLIDSQNSETAIYRLGSKEQIIIVLVKFTLQAPHPFEITK